MSDDEYRFGLVRRLPIIWTTEQAARRIGTSKQVVLTLISLGELRALGDPKNTAPRYVEGRAVEKRCQDSQFLDDVVNIGYIVNRIKNRTASAEDIAALHRKKRRRHRSSSPNDIPYTSHTDLPDA